MNRDIGDLLVENGQITEEELKGALQQAESTSEPTGRLLIRLGLVNEDNLKTVLELNYGVSYLNLKKADPIEEIVALVPGEVAYECCAAPVKKTGKRLTLAMVTPSDNEGLDKIKHYLKDWQIHMVVCSDDGFQDFMARAYPLVGAQPVAFPQGEFLQRENNQEDVVDLGNMFDSDVVGMDLGVDEGRAIVLLTQHILANAINKGCSNIHIEPAERQVLVHYRKEGVLFSARKLPKAILPDLVQRFKAMVTQGGVGANLPVDGLLNVRHNGKILRCRLSIVPGTYGQHLVIWLE